MAMTDVDGVMVGHWTDPVARTGCTVILFPEATVASGEVRGGAPATREFALLAPENLVGQVDAVVLSGGSAFGLAAGDGVMRWLEERGRGFPTKHGPVPIVVGMSLYDLAVGDATVRPGPTEGYAAAEQASDTGGGPIRFLGAGAGATSGKWGGDEPAPAGLASTSVREGDLVVAALIAVNAFGFIGETEADLTRDPVPPISNTTIGVVATNARLDKLGCLRLAQGAHDGVARAVLPAHTAFDGDAIVAASTGEVESHPEVVRTMAVLAVGQAIADLAP